MMIDPAAIGATLAAFALGAWGVLSQRKASAAETRVQVVEAESRNVSASDLSRRNQELAEAYRQKADEWQQAFKKEHEENLTYHDWVHAEAKKTNLAMLKMTEENARLLARTDLTPVLDHIAQQAVTNERVAETLTKLVSAVDHLVERLGDGKKHL